MTLHFWRARAWFFIMLSDVDDASLFEGESLVLHHVEHVDEPIVPAWRQAHRETTGLDELRAHLQCKDHPPLDVKIVESSIIVCMNTKINQKAVTRPR
jgi:hypothetical protein